MLEERRHSASSLFPFLLRFVKRGGPIKRGQRAVVIMAGAVALLSMAIGPDDFTFVMPVSPETGEGQRLIAVRAIEICNGRYPQLGRYRFSGLEQLSSSNPQPARFEVRQELSCLDAPPKPPSAEQPVPADWQPSAEDIRLVNEQTWRYFAAVDAGRSHQIEAMLNRGLREADTPEQRSADLAQFRRDAGTPGPHRIIKLTWYVNRDQAPGVYAAVDFERSYSGMLGNCGYLIWFREAAGRYVLSRIESSQAMRQDSRPTPSPEQLRAMLRCAD